MIKNYRVHYSKNSPHDEIDVMGVTNTEVIGGDLLMFRDDDVVFFAPSGAWVSYHITEQYDADEYDNWRGLDDDTVSAIMTLRETARELEAKQFLVRGVTQNESFLVVRYAPNEDYYPIDKQPEETAVPDESPEETAVSLMGRRYAGYTK